MTDSVALIVNDDWVELPVIGVDSVTLPVGNPSMSCSPTTGSTSQTLAVDVFGDFTAYIRDNPTLVLSGSGTAVILGQTILSDSHIQLSLYVGLSAATLTLTDPTNGTSATIAVSLEIATGVTLTGPTHGGHLATSSAFTVGLTPTTAGYGSTVTVTPHDGGDGGTFAPTSVTLTANVLGPTATFTYTPAGDGTVILYETNDKGLLDAQSIDYVSPDPVLPQYSLGSTATLLLLRLL